MSLTRQDPFLEFRRVPARQGFFGRDWETHLPTTAWIPVVDIFENDNEVVVKAELPGVNVKNINLWLENNVLTLKGERRFEKETKEEDYHRIEREYGAFTRSLALPTAVNGDKVTAKYKDGILKVVLPKNERKSTPLKVEIA
jgi:HSP20 family protein